MDANQGQGVLCQTAMTDGVGPCGIPTKKAGGKDIDAAWSNNGATQLPIDGYPANDYFYQYGPLFGDMRCTNPANPNDQTLVLWKVSDPVKGIGACTNPNFQPGYFGYKVLGVSYGGTLQLFGYKGTPLPKAPAARHACSRFFGNQGIFNSQGAMGAPSQFASQSAPETSGGGGSPEVLPRVVPWSSGMAAGATVAAAAAAVATVAAAAVRAVTTSHALPTVTVGTNTLAPDDVPTSTGCSWLRLDADAARTKRHTQLTLSNATDDRWWSSDDPTPDEVVVTTTDYLPGHSEKLTISKIDGKTGDLEPVGSPGPTAGQDSRSRADWERMPSAFSTPAWTPT